MDVVVDSAAPGTLAAPTPVGPGGRKPLDHLVSPLYPGGGRDTATALSFPLRVEASTEPAPSPR